VTELDDEVQRWPNAPLANDEPGSVRTKNRKIARPTCPWSTRTSLIEHISAEVVRCRQMRSAVSLVLIELDDLPNLSLIAGPEAGTRILQHLGSSISELSAGEGTPRQISNTRFAVLLRNCERQSAVEFGWRITDVVRSWSHANGMRATLSVSIGVASLAMPPRNFPSEELLTASERCLSGVQLSGGDSVKSIDIY
jgi:diguanylate cyclase (GGDEF)-like protein